MISNLVNLVRSDDVLGAEKGRGVAGLVKGVNDVALVIVQPPATMRQPRHAVIMGVHPGEQSGAARGTGWSGGVILSK